MEARRLVNDLRGAAEDQEDVGVALALPDHDGAGVECRDAAVDALLILAAAQLLLDLFGKAETAGGPAIDLELAADVPPDVARRRVIGIFFWVAGFILLVFLLGFPIAVPLFILCYLRLQSHESWWLSLSLTAFAWGFFYGIFERLIHLRFEDGLLQTWLGL